MGSGYRLIAKFWSLVVCSCSYGVVVFIRLRLVPQDRIDVLHGVLLL